MGHSAGGVMLASRLLLVEDDAGAGRSEEGWGFFEALSCSICCNRGFGCLASSSRFLACGDNEAAALLHSIHGRAPQFVG